MDENFDPLSKPINNSLIQEKIELVSNSQFLSKGEVNFNFHGIPIKLKSDSEIFLKKVTEYLPSTWVKQSEEPFVINHLSIKKYQSEHFENEPSSLAINLTHNNKEFGIQRDFVAQMIDKRSCNVMFSEDLDDGFHNFFRWFLSPKILKFKKAMIHSSVVLKDHENAVIFLGPSGAGKTTITELSPSREFLSDDMNLLSLRNGELYVQAGGVGGLYKPTVPLDNIFKVSNIFWLKQNTTNYVEDIPLIQQSKNLLSSLANLPWDSFDAERNKMIFKLTNEFLNLRPIKNLNFKKDSSFWEILDEQG